jgi:hypothetical protein
MYNAMRWAQASVGTRWRLLVSCTCCLIMACLQLGISLGLLRFGREEQPPENNIVASVRQDIVWVLLGAQCLLVLCSSVLVPIQALMTLRFLLSGATCKDGRAAMGGPLNGATKLDRGGQA